MKRSSEKQDLPNPLFESFSAVIIAIGLPDKSMDQSDFTLCAPNNRHENESENEFKRKS